MSANHYSQMLCQLSYGEGFLPSDAPIPAGHGPPLQVPDPQNPPPWAHVIPANPAPCPRPPRSRGCDPDARLPRRQGEASTSWRPDLGLSAHSAGTLLAPLTPPARRLLRDIRTAWGARGAGLIGGAELHPEPSPGLRRLVCCKRVARQGKV